MAYVQVTRGPCAQKKEVTKVTLVTGTALK